jgi:hypothetical protein
MVEDCKKVMPVMKAISRTGPVCEGGRLAWKVGPQGHLEDCQTTAQPYGLELLQLEGEGRPGVAGEGEIINGMCYRQILNEKLELFMRQLGTTQLLQDGAPCHRSKLVSSWLRRTVQISIPLRMPDPKAHPGAMEQFTD